MAWRKGIPSGRTNFLRAIHMKTMTVSVSWSTPFRRHLSKRKANGTWGFSDENGTIVELEMYWPTKEYFNIFKSEVESLKTPVTVNTIVLQEVSKAFDKYANGNGNLDEVVKSIGDNIDLILAE